MDMQEEKKLAPFPLGTIRRLTATEAAEAARLRSVSDGIVIGYNDHGEVIIVNFGSLQRKDALWLSERLRIHALGEDS